MCKHFQNKTGMRKTLVLSAAAIFLFTVTLVVVYRDAVPFFGTRGVFTDVIAGAGISTLPTAGGVSWGDYDSDGYLDLLMRPHGGSYVLYRNDGDGTFTDVTESAGLASITHFANSATFGDYDNDGCSDLFVSQGLNNADSAKPDALYRNNCDGTFTDVSKEAGVTVAHHGKGVAWGDFDRDGFLDIYVATYGGLSFRKSDTAWKLIGWTFEPNVLYRNNRDGTFTNVTKRARVSGEPFCTKYKEEELLELGSTQGGVGSVEYLTKTDAGLKPNWQAVWFDYDNDGFSDLYVSNEVAINALYHNNGDGTFTDTTERAGLCQKQSTHGIAVGDYNGDGFFDIYATGSRRNILWHNNGDGTFTEISERAGVANFGFLGWGTGALDYDNDGLLDIYSINGSTQNTSVKSTYPEREDRLYKNNGDGPFTEPAKESGITGNDSKSFGAFGDFNNDGFTDVFVVSDEGFEPAGANRLYRNTPNGNHWLTVKLVGVKSNREGVGAVIIAEVAGNKRVRQVLSGGSFVGQNSIWQTFGLGKSTVVDTLTVLWPSGIRQTLHSVPVDRILSVREASE